MEVAGDPPVLELIDEPAGLRQDVQLVQARDASEVVQRGRLVAGDEQRPGAARTRGGDPGAELQQAPVQLTRAQRHTHARGR